MTHILGIIFALCLPALAFAQDVPRIRHERGHCNQFRAGIRGDVHTGWREGASIGIFNRYNSGGSNQDGNQGFR